MHSRNGRGSSVDELSIRQATGLGREGVAMAAATKREIRPLRFGVAAPTASDLPR